MSRDGCFNIDTASRKAHAKMNCQRMKRKVLECCIEPILMYGVTSAQFLNTYKKKNKKKKN